MTKSGHTLLMTYRIPHHTLYHILTYSTTPRTHTPYHPVPHTVSTHRITPHPHTVSPRTHTPYHPVPHTVSTHRTTQHTQPRLVVEALNQSSKA